MRSLAGAGFLCLIVLVGGCGLDARESFEEFAGGQVRSASPQMEVKLGRALEDMPIAQDGAVPRPGMGHDAAERKIIYTASLEVVVTEFDGVERQIETLVRSVGGYVAGYRAQQTQGQRRGGEWTVRVPVTAFAGFLIEIGKLGVPESRQVWSQDVSEEFVDLEARLANQHRLEERLLQVLTEQTGKLEDLLKVETELARVREQIERHEGRLRFLTNRVDLATVTISVREQRDYVPPEAPSFVARLRRTFHNSLNSLAATGEQFALGVVALAPWSPFVAPLIALPIVVVRRWRRRRSD